MKKDGGGIAVPLIPSEGKTARKREAPSIESTYTIRLRKDAPSSYEEDAPRERHFPNLLGFEKGGGRNPSQASESTLSRGLPGPFTLKMVRVNRILSPRAQRSYKGDKARMDTKSLHLEQERTTTCPETPVIVFR